MTEPLDTLTAAARSGGGVTELERGLWLVTDPTETERLLASKDTSTARSARHTGVTSWGPDGLDTWMAVRRAAHPYLTASRLTSAIPVIAEQAERAVSGWPSPGIVDAGDETVNLISAINIRYLLGEPSEALSALVERELALAGRTRWPFPLGRRRLRHAQHATYNAIRQHIRARPSPTGLQAVLTDHGFDEHTVTSALRTMLLSSHHVPATALAWALHELSTHPDVQERARAEAAAHPEPTADLPLCRAVIRETLRLHPPVWRLRRQLTAPTRGLPTGTDLLFSPYLNHHDPDTYPVPSGFHPQRWSPGFRPAPGTYLPFALGPRTCPASTLALAQLTVVLAVVLKNHRLAPHRDPAPTFGALHAPRHLRLRVLPA